jgi:Tfp pilus assembly protein PilO
MRGPSSKRTSWFVTLPIAAGALGYLWFVFLPTARAIRETRNEIRIKQDFIMQTEALHSTVAQLERDLKEIESYTQQWHEHAAAPGQLPNLFGKITQQAHDVGVVPTRFDPLKETTMEILHRAPVQMELTGGYQEVTRMLAAIEQLPETIWIEQLKIEKARENGKDVKCELKLEIFAVKSKKSG